MVHAFKQKLRGRWGRRVQIASSFRFNSLQGNPVSTTMSVRFSQGYEKSDIEGYIVKETIRLIHSLALLAMNHCKSRPQPGLVLR